MGSESWMRGLEPLTGDLTGVLSAGLEATQRMTERAASAASHVGSEAQQFFHDHDEEIRAAAQMTWGGAKVVGHGLAIVWDVLGEMGEGMAEAGGGFQNYDG